MDLSSLLQNVRLSQFAYDLPAHLIAQYPLANRDEARLLVYKKGEIQHAQFLDLPTHLPEKTLLVLNDTKVIHARLYFKRQTGATIEVLLLNPVEPRETALAMQQKGKCTWKCVIGNKKKWREEEILGQSLPLALPDATNTDHLRGINLKAHLVDRAQQWVEFQWEGDIAFSEMLEKLGQVPLPPYLNRSVSSTDTLRYQTIYSAQTGAVAAPTAGLHYTENVFQALEQKGAKMLYATLHVGGGTFLPVKSEQVMHHDMHAEEIYLTIDHLKKIIAHNGIVVAAGTTAMRWLESVYWLGVQIKYDFSSVKQPFFIPKLFPYPFLNTAAKLLEREEAFQHVLAFMERNGMESWNGKTALMIVPGYTFRVCGGLQTNFHMPETTLLFLVAAFIGTDWKKIYEKAIQLEYRMLSYGDSSLLLP